MKTDKKNEVVMVYDHFGNPYKTKADMCKAYNIPYHVFDNRIRRGFNLKDALTKPVKEKKMIVVINGIEYNISQLAKEYNKPAYLVKQRLDSGWDLIDALKTPNKHERYCFVDDDGELIKSAKRFAVKYHMSKETVRKYLNAGYNFAKIKELKNEYGSVNVHIVRDILKELNIDFSEEHSLSGDAKSLRFDFHFIVNWEYAIECDGQQHFKQNHFERTNSQYYIDVNNDNKKNAFCKNNKIKLLRIRYDYTFDMIHAAILNLINDKSDSFWVNILSEHDYYMNRENPSHNIENISEKTPVFDHLGIPYESTSEMARCYGLPCKTVLWRINHGWSIKNALTITPSHRNNNKSASFPVTDHKGIPYESEHKMCNAYSIPYHTYLSRVKTNGWSKEDALTKPVRKFQKVKAIELDKIFNSVKEATLFFDIAQSSISLALKNPNRRAAGYHWCHV